ncbi:hypothetical protein BNJ_00086 [Kaumoebavirus]|uniref:thymidylate kinase n=1 Tax=Kaumoebavirus TaxID=1859492 RepID=UPI0009C382D3|nr:thymidylate kinase [Kaumoebavirus]ARA71926.1 hypothetical protein BNJ_00086 [Kaumoebavirus]
MQNTLTMRKTKIINIIGAPGCGKSTISGYLFSMLKIAGKSVEYAQEFAKTLVWKKEFDTLNNQMLVSKQQYELLRSMTGSVDFIVTDGPIIHGIYYNRANPDNVCNVEKVDEYILNRFNEFDNINIFLEHNPDITYEQEGRIQTEKEAREVGKELKNILDSYKIPYYVFKNGGIVELNRIFVWIITEFANDGFPVAKNPT